ncbi:hypothetical protein Desti_4576 [Desulfomonile tiedjei DSM 6799]|uniref:Uncharacterized protein n=1 Tax=Desulfomonile tiedjei (strain ATCC 49306 / DSM 6799 / DCB-1) TaxID=706587 RepID=I4CCB2_DESTA|nr:hypothetical protein Desti_4576 [Desulfomonile tiedjei DSM 6799]
MFQIANKYLDEWRRTCHGKIYVLTNLFGERKRVYIEKCFDHWFPREDSEDLPLEYSEEDIAYRLSLLPCVREVLVKLPHEPIQNPSTGNWEVEARIPRPRDPQSNRIEVIRVVIACDAANGWHLKTYHPYWDTTRKKK